MSLGDWYLNGTKLSPYNFSFAESFEVVGADERLLDGTLRRDIVARKRVVEMSWEFLPEIFDGTYHCYADLQALGTMAGTMVMIRPTGTSSGTTQCNVFADVPQGDLAHRSDGSKVYWNVEFRVMQQ